MQLAYSVRMALALVESLVPGATPKKPASGLMAYRCPSGPNFIQQMSSPIVSTFQPGSVGSSMARLVLPQAEGKAAAMSSVCPPGSSMPTTSMCSAIQHSCRPRKLAILRARHFLPRSTFPP
jgi:hypothetical protein